MEGQGQREERETSSKDADTTPYRDGVQDGSTADDDEEISDDQDSGHGPLTWSQWASKYRVVLQSAAKAGALFLFCLVFLVLLLKALLPPIDPNDRPAVKIPRNFDDLKHLNDVLQIYKERNFARVLGSWIALYLFLQAYSLPGSMYLSILAGAMYGIPFALPLVCASVATGATLCYLISALLGPALLLASEKWRTRLDVWRERIRQQQGNMFSYMIILRIAPLPPHWMVNIAAPHLSISVPLFWSSTFFGVMAVSFIHVQIGTTLDQMSSANEFNLISWRNFFGLAGVVVGAMFPVAIRYYYGGELKTLAVAGSDEAPEIAPADSGYASNDHTVVNVAKDGHSDAMLADDSKLGKDRAETLLVRMPPDTANAKRGGSIRL